MAIPDEPLSRLEQYLNKIATESGTIPEVPLTRLELYLNRIATGSGNVPETPHTRLEMYLNKIATGSGNVPEAPYTRAEMYLNKIATGDGNTPEEALTRIEMYLAEIAQGGGGSSNGLLDGSYKATNAGYNGDVFTVEDNVVTLTIPIGPYKNFEIPFISPIPISSSDVVTITGTPVVSGSGSIDDVNMSGLLGLTSGYWTYTLPFNSQKTLNYGNNTDGVATTLNFSAHYFTSGDNRSIRISISINGEVIF